MLITQIGKRVSSAMISQLNNVLKFPLIYQTHCPSSFTLARSIHCFQNSSQKAVKISRAAKNDAQAALFDYLHSTRGFNYVDAEHMCKNSPHFIHGLIARVNNEQDVLRALSRLLRYNPINEFEPFLESLGLNPLEVSTLLPDNLMFLEDDHVLLRNFRVLCDYGFPRTGIGKIYREAVEVFSYELGILTNKIMACEKLGLCRHTVIKLVTCCPSILVGEVDRGLLEVLDKLARFGFERDWIGGYLSSNNTYCWNRMLNTINFLVEVGCDDKQIGDLIKKNPALLFEGSGRQIYILAGCFLKLGLTTEEVCALFVDYPEILSPKCAENIWKALYLLFEAGVEADCIADILCAHVHLLASHSVKGLNTLLRHFSGDKLKLVEFIKTKPSEFLALASKSNVSSIEQLDAKNPGKLVEKIIFLSKLGYVENSDEMRKALNRFRGRGDQLQERFDCLVEAGLDSNVVSDMIKQAPTTMNQSRDVLEKKIASLRYIGYPIESLASFPTYLCYDIERINLRFSMYMWLKEKGAAKPMLSLSTLLACSDARFIKYFVDVHPEGPIVWERLKGR